MKTLYIWDLANTLFIERWDKKKSGVSNYNAYVASLGFDLKTIDPLDYEMSYKKPYELGLYNLSLAPGFKKILTYTKNNAVFTTGNREQMDWRAKQLYKKYHFDVKRYIIEIYSTFDFKNTNVKTIEMLKSIIIKKYRQGYKAFVYTDDKKENCIFFLNAIHGLAKTHKDLKTRVYYLKNKGSGLAKIDRELFKVGNLNAIFVSERVFQLDKRLKKM